MMLTRSFITSYFIMPDDDKNTIERIKLGVESVNKTGILTIREPDERQKARLKNAIIDQSHIYKSQYQMVEDILSEFKITERTYRKKNTCTD